MVFSNVELLQYLIDMFEGTDEYANNVQENNDGTSIHYRSSQCCQQFMLLFLLKNFNYCIARNFRGLKFSQFSRINDEPQKFYPPKFYLWLTYVARERNPRKLNREKFGQG